MGLAEVRVQRCGVWGVGGCGFSKGLRSFWWILVPKQHGAPERTVLFLAFLGGSCWCRVFMVQRGRLCWG